MARTPTVPPMSQPLVDKDGRLTQPWYKFLTGEREYSTNVNTGVNRARAEAAAAQSTASAASQTAQAQASNSFTVTLNVPFLYEFSENGGTQTTASATVTASGGTSPYTYAWSKVSGDTLTLSGASSNNTTFAGDPSADADGTLTAEYKCTVTDNVAATAEIVIGVTIVYLGV